jgi:DNA-binding HxlR family transcriptional regulator
MKEMQSAPDKKISGILERIVYPEVPPHVEYQLTDFGQRFMPILDSIEQLQHELEMQHRNHDY